MIVAISQKVEDAVIEGFRDVAWCDLTYKEQAEYMFERLAHEGLVIVRASDLAELVASEAEATASRQAYIDEAGQ